MFDILHHGAVRGVTGSCHQLRLALGDSVLIDCGLFQGSDSDIARTSSDELADELSDEFLIDKQIDFSLIGGEGALSHSLSY